MTRESKPPKSKDLETQVENLQSEITRKIVIKQNLIDTRGLLDRERGRFQGIQACTQKLLRAEEMDTFVSILLESILQTFEFEVSLFTRYDSNRQCLNVAGQAGFAAPPTSLPFSIDWLKDNTGVILESGHKLLEKWAPARLEEAIICPFFSDKDDAFAGLVIGGLTKENLDHFDCIKAEVISSFSVMVAQASALLSNFELKSKMKEQTIQLERYSKTLEFKVEERTKALRQANKELDTAYRQNLGHLRKTEKELDHQELLARTDELTGLHNRRFMDAQLKTLVEQSRSGAGPFGILMIDLDGFKPINDTFGHPCGDAVLKAVAQILRASFRHSDILCRVGGDEFAIIMPGISSERGRQVAEQVRKRIEALPGVESNRDIKLSASLGGTLHTAAEKAADLISRVDRYLYRAKRNGRNQVVWNDVTSGELSQQ